MSITGYSSIQFGHDNAYCAINGSAIFRPNCDRFRTSCIRTVVRYDGGYRSFPAPLGLTFSFQAECILTLVGLHVGYRFVSVVCLSVVCNACIVAKQYVLPENCLNRPK